MNKYKWTFLGLALLLKPLMAISHQCSDVFKNTTTSTDRRTVMGTELPRIAEDLASAFRAKSLNPEKTFFIILPGNIGKAWEKTNHNIGYELLVPLIKHYKAVGSTHKQNFQQPLETLTFHPKDLGEDFAATDTQAFYSEAHTYRSTTGEAFVAASKSPNGATLVFLRRNGYYNDGGNFFIPFIKQAGGKTKNIIVIHDDLKISGGKIEVSADKSPYDGNRAILSIHNNINALNLSAKIHQNKQQVLANLFGPFSGRLAEFHISADQVIRQVEASVWKSVVEIKNQGDPVSFRASFSSNLKTKYVELLKQISVQAEAKVHRELFSSLELARAEIKTATDKKSAADHYKATVTKASEQHPSYKDHLRVSEMLSNAESKKGEALQKVYSVVADQFDPRVMENSFASIRLGMDYEGWKAKGQDLKGPMPITVEESERGSFTHFVLSQRDEQAFGASFEKQVIEAIDNLVKRNSH